MYPQERLNRRSHWEDPVMGRVREKNRVTRGAENSRAKGERRVISSMLLNLISVHDCPTASHEEERRVES